MASVIKRKNGWQCEVRIKGYTSITKTLKYFADAKPWGLDTELKIK